MFLHIIAYDNLLENYCIFLKGECSCGKDAIETTVYVTPDKSQALASWSEPGFQCATGADAKVETIIKNPPVTSPSYFSEGKHVILYTYKLKGDVTVTCPVAINVIGELYIQTSP